jgi:tryptophan 2,3-dioxygenase
MMAAMSFKSYGVKDLKASDLTYDTYLNVKELLSLQKLQSDQHDETLFIIIHQVYELWFKQILHELTALENALTVSQPMKVIKILRRVLRIQDVLNQQINILETMTPNEFNYFRSKLNPASGFQSHQFRALEFRLGLKNEGYLKYYENDIPTQDYLKDLLAKPTVYDAVLEFFGNNGLAVKKPTVTNTVRQADEHIEKEFAKVYMDPTKYHEIYEILELLLDMDQKLSIWRFRHVQMVERIIGITRGTGGSQGVQYLTSTLEKRAFPEIWNCRRWVITHLE